MKTFKTKTIKTFALVSAIAVMSATLALNITALSPATESPFPAPYESYFNLRVHLDPEYDTSEKANELFFDITGEYGSFKPSTDFTREYIGEVGKIQLLFSKNITSEEQAEDVLEAYLSDYYATADTSHGVDRATQPTFVKYNEITPLSEFSDTEYLSKYNYVTTATGYDGAGDFGMFLEKNSYEDIAVEYLPIPQPAYECYTYDWKFICDDWDNAFDIQEEIDERAMRTLLSYVTLWDDGYRNIIYTPEEYIKPSDKTSDKTTDPNSEKPNPKTSSTGAVYVEPEDFSEYGYIYAGSNCSDLMAEYVRSGNKYFSFMPLDWVREVYLTHQDVAFSPTIGLTTEDYIFTPDDYPEFKITEWTQHSPTQYWIRFETFDEAYLAYKWFSEKSQEENYPIIGVQRPSEMSTCLDIRPTWEEIMDYMTPEEMAENKDALMEKYESDKEDPFYTLYSPDYYNDTTPSPEKTAVLRQSKEARYDTFKEHRYNSFMPNKWFYEKGEYFFQKFLAVEFVRGYKYNAEDFAEYGVVSIEESFENYSHNYYYLEQNTKNYNVKCMVFDSYESMTASYEKLKENPNILRINKDWGSYLSSQLLLPTREDIETYLTPAEIEENAEILEEVFEVIDVFYGSNTETNPNPDSSDIIIPNTPLPEATLYGDLDNDNKVQLSDIVVLCKAISAEDINTVLTPQEIANADVFADGILDSADLSVFSSAMVNSQLSSLPIVGNNEE